MQEFMELNLTFCLRMRAGERGPPPRVFFVELCCPPNPLCRNAAQNRSSDRIESGVLDHLSETVLRPGRVPSRGTGGRRSGRSYGLGHVALQAGSLLPGASSSLLSPCSCPVLSFAPPSGKAHARNVRRGLLLDLDRRRHLPEHAGHHHPPGQRRQHPGLSRRSTPWASCPRDMPSRLSDEHLRPTSLRRVLISVPLCTRCPSSSRSEFLHSSWAAWAQSPGSSCSLPCPRHSISKCWRLSAEHPLNPGTPLPLWPRLSSMTHLLFRNPCFSHLPSPTEIHQRQRDLIA